MKIVYAKEGTLKMPTGVISPIAFNFVTPRVTQILPKNAEKGGLSQRGAGYRSIYAKNPVMIVYVTPVNASPWLLHRIQCRASVVTYDSFGAGDGSTQIPDIVNIDAGGLLATMGRLNFDLKIYATSEVRLEFRNRSAGVLQLKVRVEIYEDD
jgi:hypothetical protein